MSENDWWNLNYHILAVIIFISSIRILACSTVSSANTAVDIFVGVLLFMLLWMFVVTSPICEA